ncbi:hypothetical protein, partial [Corynebacterium otitidis]|uniref:hypothetical protein n=1 Tax=Corynebacterium otitidis TaxID=29321 RepID=UPI000627BFD5
GRQALRYLYRIMFVLFAEESPELEILPADELPIVWGEGDACFAVLGGDILADELDRLPNRLTQIIRH